MRLNKLTLIWFFTVRLHTQNRRTNASIPLYQNNPLQGLPVGKPTYLGEHILVPSCLHWNALFNYMSGRIITTFEYLAQP